MGIVTSKKNTKGKPLFRTVRLGVYEVVLPVSSHLPKSLLDFQSQFQQISEFLSLVPVLLRFYQEIYSLAPWQFCVVMLLNLVHCAENTAGLYFDNKIVETISDQLSGKQFNQTRTLHAILARLISSILFNWVTHLCRKQRYILDGRVKFHFILQSLRVNLKLDVPTAEDADVRSRFRRDDEGISIGHGPGSRVCLSFKHVNSLLVYTLKTLSQLVLAFKLASSGSSGLFFVALCIARPITELFGVVYLRARTHVSYCVDPIYTELATLYNWAFKEEYRIDRLSDGVADYIETEFIRNRKLLGDACTTLPQDQWYSNQPLLLKVLRDAFDHLPMCIFALKVLYAPGNMTLGTFVMQQRMADDLGWNLELLRHYLSSAGGCLDHIKRQYALADIQNKLQDGDTPYPATVIANSAFAAGMQIEFCNVSFAYPGTYKDVLRDLSFTMKPGQLVVIVGINGSGKSSLIKLFNRLYAPTKGKILIDGQPLSSFKIADVRRAMSILRQDHRPYPVSLRRNVALGRPDHAATDEEFQEAIHFGGAQDFIEKLPQKSETVLQPVVLSKLEFKGSPIEEMKQMVDEREKATDISGGESQRLAASRMFMRLRSGRIRFLAADEPTSALDPEAEYQLFTRLRQQRKGKTMVFITHRFGHLTKHADMILCMKDGCLVEQGSHEELISKGGEYFRLHDIQARAFAPN